jgi:hypothetical protein
MMNTQTQENTLIVQPRRAIYFFGGAGIIVVILSFISQYIRLFPDIINVHYPIQADFIHDFILEFNFNGQSDIAIYYNLLILNVAACLLFVIAYLKKMNKDPYRYQWTATAWITLFFALDNLAELHQKMQALFQDKESMGAPEYAWIAALVILAVLFFRFCLRLDRKYRFLFLTSVILYFVGTLGQTVTSFYNSKEFIYSLFLTIEQALQYGGVTLLIYSLLIYLTSSFPSFFISTNGLTDRSGNTQQDAAK